MSPQPGLKLRPIIKPVSASRQSLNMALVKEVVIDKIEVLESGSIQVRQATRVLEDGEVLSTSYQRHVLERDADLTNEDPKVVAIASAAWGKLIES
jgi:hypothetical protein